MTAGKAGPPSTRSAAFSAIISTQALMLPERCAARFAEGFTRGASFRTPSAVHGRTGAQVDPAAWGAPPAGGRVMQVDMKTAATPGNPLGSLKTGDGRPILFALFLSE